MKPTRSAPAPDSLVARVRGWVGRPLGRAALVLAGLVVLSLVGRFAVAGGRVPPAPPSVVPSAIARAPLAVADSASVSAAASGSGSASAAVPPHAARATTDNPVYLNDATVDDLRRLPGIGPKRALAVLALRQRLGRFRQIEDLLRVRGIGRSTLRRLRPLVRLDHPASADGGAP